MPKECPDCGSPMEKIYYDAELIYKCTNNKCLVEINSEDIED